MTELNAVEVQEVSGALNIIMGIYAGVHAYCNGSDLGQSYDTGRLVAFLN
ncbi:MAG: hypothetical protein H7176_11775 [Bdellovibrionales bacterium]|nr:hypothetical protein [Massilia sp.]